MLGIILQAGLFHVELTYIIASITETWDCKSTLSKHILLLFQAAPVQDKACLEPSPPRPPPRMLLEVKLQTYAC